MKASIDRETQQIKAQIAALDAETSSMTALTRQTDEEIINFKKSWDAAVPTRRREIQNALFPDGLAYDPETFYFCPSNPSLLQRLNAVLNDMGLVGVPDGI